MLKVYIHTVYIHVSLTFWISQKWAIVLMLVSQKLDMFESFYVESGFTESVESLLPC